jgi:hypothetical protein
VVDAQLVGERQIESGVEAVAQDVPGQVPVALHVHARQAELALLVVPVRVVLLGMTNEELRHVVQPELVEMVGADHHQDVGVRLCQRLAERLDLAHPLGRERRGFVGRRGAGLVVEGVMRGRDHRGKLGHAASS